MKNVQLLRREKQFKNDKIEISYSIGDITNALSVYLYDSEGKSHHVYWYIIPDRCNQNFSKLNDKIKSFVQKVVDEWVSEEELIRVKEEDLKKKREEKEEDFIKGLVDNF